MRAVEQHAIQKRRVAKMYDVRLILIVLMFAGITFCVDRADKLYSRRTGKKSPIRSSFDLLEFNKNEAKWLLFACVLFVIAIVAFVVL